MNLKNPNRWFLLFASLIMTAIAAVSYIAPGKAPFAHEGMAVMLYRLNYVLLTWIMLATGSISLLRTYGVLSGWFMIFLVVSNWMHFMPDAVFHFTKGDNLLHTNLGLISIFIGVMYGEEADPEA